MTDGERRLEAPHRRTGASPRIVERSAVLGYRFASWLLRTLPAGPTGAVLGLGAQGSYLLWPTKRAWSNRNFGHVLGLPPDDPRVRRVALRAYRRYGTYLVELMRVPYMPQDEVMALVEPLDPAEIARLRDASPVGGLIVTTGHVGNNDVIGAAIAHLGLPLNVVADDSSFPELFEYLRAQREQWSATLIPWRNLRAIFGVLRRREVLGLLVDWGYRSDGIPVRLFDAWTALPAGPGDARRQDPVAHPAGHQHPPARRPDARPVQRADHGRVVRPGRAPAGDPAHRRRPGRDDPARPRRLVQLQADLAADRRRERRPRAARARDDGRAARIRDPDRASAARMAWPRPMRRPLRWWPTRDPPRPTPAGDVVAGLPAARGPGVPLRRLRRRPLVPVQARPRRPGPAQPAARLPVAGRVRPRRSAGQGRGHGPEGARAPRQIVVPARRPLLPRGRPEPVDHAGLRRRAARPRHARAHRRGGRAGQGRPLRRAPFRVARARGHLPGVPGRRDRHADGDHRRPRPAGLLRADPRRRRHPPGRPARGAPGAARRAPRRHPGRSRRRPRPDRRRDGDPAVRGARAAADGSGDARRRDRRADLRR